MELNKEKCKQKKVKKRLISIRISEDIHEWLKDNKISSTKTFMEAIKSLGYKENDK